MLRILIFSLFVLIPTLGRAVENQAHAALTKEPQRHSTAKITEPKTIKQKSDNPHEMAKAAASKQNSKLKKHPKPAAKKQMKAKHTKVKHSQKKTKTKHAKLNLMLDSEAGGLNSDINKLANTEDTSAAENAISNKIKLKAQQLLAYATQLVGTQYRYGGGSPETGFDCSGYVSYVYKNVTGIALPHSAAAISKVGVKVARNDLRPGDLVFFRNIRRGVGHVGIYMGDDRFIHASSAASGYVHVSNLHESYWIRHFQGARRLMNSRENYEEINRS